MINNILLTALNEQFNRERYNRDTYRAISHALASVNWPGSAAWMKKASDEEQEHADKFADYIIDRGGEVESGEVVGVVVPTSDVLSAFESALRLEQENTEAIKTLYYLAEEQEDPQTCSWLIWALDEQTQAEREITDILNMLRRLDDNGKVFFDHELGEE